MEYGKRKCPGVTRYTSSLLGSCGGGEIIIVEPHIIFRRLLVQHESTRIRIVYVNKHWKRSRILWIIRLTAYAGSARNSNKSFPPHFNYKL